MNFRSLGLVSCFHIVILSQFCCVSVFVVLVFAEVVLLFRLWRRGLPFVGFLIPRPPKGCFMMSEGLGTGFAVQTPKGVLSALRPPGALLLLACGSGSGNLATSSDRSTRGLGD